MATVIPPDGCAAVLVGVGLAHTVAGHGLGSGGDGGAEQGCGGDGPVRVQACFHEASGLELVVAPAAWTQIRHAGGAAGPGLVVVQIATASEPGTVIGRAPWVHGVDVLGDRDGGFVGVGVQVG